MLGRHDGITEVGSAYTTACVEGLERDTIMRGAVGGSQCWGLALSRPHKPTHDEGPAVGPMHAPFSRPIQHHPGTKTVLWEGQNYEVNLWPSACACACHGAPPMQHACMPGIVREALHGDPPAHADAAAPLPYFKRLKILDHFCLVELSIIL